MHITFLSNLMGVCYSQNGVIRGAFHVPCHVSFLPISVSLLLLSLQGVFIQLVQANSPAALAGLRFGDQVLQINGQNCAGWSLDKAHKALKAASETRIELIVRDRWVACDILSYMSYVYDV